MELDDATATLTKLGFTDTEALVYCELLRKPGQTGYSVAKALKKSQANVYGALATLTTDGAVEFSAGDVRTFQAVPPGELLPRLAREYAEKSAAAERALARIASEPSEDWVYQLKHADQVFERAASMAGRASQSIAFQLFPGPFQRVKPALAAAVQRGVGVAGVTFDPGDIVEGATCVLSVKFGRQSAWPQAPSWPRDHMGLVVDAREALVALFDRTTHEVVHALYTDSVYIACLLHSAIVDSVVLNLEGPEFLKESLNKRLFGAVPSGFVDLIGS